MRFRPNSPRLTSLLLALVVAGACATIGGGCSGKIGGPRRRRQQRRWQHHRRRQHDRRRQHHRHRGQQRHGRRRRGQRPGHAVRRDLRAGRHGHRRGGAAPALQPRIPADAAGSVPADGAAGARRHPARRRQRRLPHLRRHPERVGAAPARVHRPGARAGRRADGGHGPAHARCSAASRPRRAACARSSPASASSPTGGRSRPRSWTRWSTAPPPTRWTRPISSASRSRCCCRRRASSTGSRSATPPTRWRR